MGVMNCNRSRCDNIICDVYIDNIGYICSSCQEEFKIYLNLHGHNNMTHDEIKKELSLFITTDKDDYSEEKMDLDNFFLKYTKY